MASTSTTTFSPSFTAEEASTELRRMLDVPNPTVHVLTRHVSQSGMSRRFSLFVIDDERPGPDRLRDVTTLVAAVLGYRVRYADHTIRVNGAGMNMQYHVVYSLSRALYLAEHPDSGGYILSKRAL